MKELYKNYTNQSFEDRTNLYKENLFKIIGENY